MKNNIFIPKKIKVGFNKREDTYTKKLAYIIYHDGKVWRKETSWSSWSTKYIGGEEYEKAKLKNYNDSIANYRLSYQRNRIEHLKNPKTSWDKDCLVLTEDQYVNKFVGDYSKYKPYLGNVSSDPSIQPIEYDNEVLEGFVLNRKVGGDSSGWNHRQTYCRVYDPRGFEFEITIPNLLYILENSNSIKGKGLDGKFIYGWDGKDLVLLPEEAPEFKEMVNFTNNLKLSVAKKDLKVGGIYRTKNGEELTFLTTAPFYDYDHLLTTEKALWFIDAKTNCSVQAISDIKKYMGDNSDLPNLFIHLEKNKGYNPSKKGVKTYTLMSDLVFNQYSIYTEVWLQAKKKNTFTKHYVTGTWESYGYGKAKVIGPYTITKSPYRRNKILHTFKTLKELIDAKIIYKETNVYEKEQ